MQSSPPYRLVRVILFTHRMDEMTVFYRDVLGLPPKADQDAGDPQWREFDAGAATIALHKAGTGGAAGEGGCAHKISFHCADIAAERARLVSLGVAMGEHHRYGSLELCDGPDPDGNRFQLCNRA